MEISRGFRRGILHKGDSSSGSADLQGSGPRGGASLRRSAIAKQCLGAKARGTSGYCRPFRLIATPNGPSKPFVICAKGLPPLGYFQ